jgi:hypothetical protein
MADMNELKIIVEMGRSRLWIIPYYFIRFMGREYRAFNKRGLLRSLLKDRYRKIGRPVHG